MAGTASESIEIKNCSQKKKQKYINRQENVEKNGLVLKPCADSGALSVKEPYYSGEKRQEYKIVVRSRSMYYWSEGLFFVQKTLNSVCG
ncbi:MAG: hypothetical protein AAGK67_10475 [Pseudomonadota bacterium]